MVRRLIRGGISPAETGGGASGGAACGGGGNAFALRLRQPIYPYTSATAVIWRQNAANARRTGKAYFIQTATHAGTDDGQNGVELLRGSLVKTDCRLR